MFGAFETPNDSSRLSVVTRGTAYLVLFFIASITVLPFLQPYHLFPIPSFYSEWLAFGLGLAAGICLLLPAFWKNLVIPRITLYLLGFAVLIAIQSLFAEQVYRSAALVPALYLCWAALLTVIAGWLRAHLGLEKVISFLAWFMLIGGVLQAATGVAQHISPSGWSDSLIFTRQGAGVVGNIAQNNHFAMHVLLGALALIYLSAKQRVPHGITLVLLVLLVIGLTMSGSRSVVMYVITAFVLSLYSGWRTRELLYLRLIVLSGLLLTLFVLAQYLLPALDESLKILLERFGFNANHTKILTALERVESTGGIEDRLIEWRKSWLMFLQAPVFGVGLGNYGWYSFSLHEKIDANTHRAALFTHAHNIFMQVLAELGLLGLLLLGVLLITWISQFRRNWLTPESWLITAVLFVLFIHSNLEYPLWFSFFLAISVVFLALGDHRDIHVRFTPQIGQAGAAISLMLTFIILIAVLNGYRVLSNINQIVIHLSPEHASKILHVVSKNPLLTSWAEAAIVRHGIPNKSLIQKQLEMTTRVMRHQPHPIDVYHQIVYLTLAGKNEKSIALLRQVASAYPPELPKYVARLKQLPYKELLPIINEGEKLIGRQAEYPSEK